LYVSGPPAARSQRSGIFVKRGPSSNFLTCARYHLSHHTSIDLSIEPTTRRVISDRTGWRWGANACPTSTTSARGFIGAISLGAYTLRARSSSQWLSASFSASCSGASTHSSGSRTYVAFATTVSAGALDGDCQTNPPARNGHSDTTSIAVQYG
jgi:hypothetical protein